MEIDALWPFVPCMWGFGVPKRFPSYEVSELLRDTSSTAGNSMTGSERPSPEPLLKKGASPAVLGGETILECSGALKCLEL